MEKWREREKERLKRGKRGEMTVKEKSIKNNLMSAINYKPL